jgi:hypothetical protein
MSTVYSTLTSLENAIYTWLDPLASEQIIWAKEKAPQPTSAYLSLNFTTLAVSEGAGFERLISGSTRTLVQRRQATLNIQAFGENAVERLWSIKDAIYTEASLEAIVTANLSIIRDEDVQDISTLLDTQIQERASMDVILGYTKSVTDGTNWIESVEVTAFGETETIDSTP